MSGSRTIPPFERSSGNVFRDLGFDRPDEEVAKASLLTQIADLVEERGVRQVDAALLLGIPQSKVSLLLRGYSDGFSTGRLMTLLTRLGQDVDIVVRPSRGRNRARVRVLRSEIAPRFRRAHRANGP